MAQQPMPVFIVPPRQERIKEEFQTDIKVITDSNKARKRKRATGSYTITLTGVDRYPWGCTKQ